MTQVLAIWRKIVRSLCQSVASQVLLLAEVLFYSRCRDIQGLSIPHREGEHGAGRQIEDGTARARAER